MQLVNNFSNNRADCLQNGADNLKPDYSLQLFSAEDSCRTQQSLSIGSFITTFKDEFLFIFSFLIHLW